MTQQVLEWKQLILRLNPELTNIPDLIRPSGKFSDLSTMSPRSILNMPLEAQWGSAAILSTPKPYNAAVTMDPTPAGYTPGRMAPSLGLLPTPRLTPQTSGFCTPAASAASSMLGKSSAMGMAMAQACNVNVSQYLDRLPVSVTSSPQSLCSLRRSSLANSISTASSPDSMVSDVSRSSRSSSISSASSLASATLSHKLGMPSRFRAAKLCNERLSQRPMVSSVPEDFNENCYSSSPESYTGPVGKLEDMVMETPLARREQELADMARDPASDAARVLQDMQNYRLITGATVPRSVRAGTKRGRSTSTTESPLQERVRDLLLQRASTESAAWPNTMVRPRGMAYDSHLRVPVSSSLHGASKRVCCSAEAAQAYPSSTVHPAIDMRGPGMWEAILN